MKKENGMINTTKALRWLSADELAAERQKVAELVQALRNLLTEVRHNSHAKEVTFAAHDKADAVLAKYQFKEEKIMTDLEEGDSHWAHVLVNGGFYSSENTDEDKFLEWALKFDRFHDAWLALPNSSFADDMLGNDESWSYELARQIDQYLAVCLVIPGYPEPSTDQLQIFHAFVDMRVYAESVFITCGYDLLPEFKLPYAHGNTD